jgi:predicted enzyme related to lactoylglutathione lyase
VGDQWKPSEDGTSVAIEVEDFDAAIKSLKQAKARFAAEGIESPVCWMAVVQDPDGNTPFCVPKAHLQRADSIFV